MTLRYHSLVELTIWFSALIFLALTDPSIYHSFSICPLHAAGMSWCPGCGLGRSISFLLHGEMMQSFTTHVLGIPALLILVHRIIQLIRTFSTFQQLQRTSH